MLLPAITSSSSFDKQTVRFPGGCNAATSKPWYFRVLMPSTVLDAYPPSPFVKSHSFWMASLKCDSSFLFRFMAGGFILWHQLGDVFLPWGTEIIFDRE